jgi:hypothetical protein
VELTNFPSQAGIISKSQPLHVPNPYNRKSGPVCTMEWSSDGYVLAVGWQHGWGIFSVGGRCLACGFGLEDSADEEKCGKILLRVCFPSNEPCQIPRHVHVWDSQFSEYNHVVGGYMFEFRASSGPPETSN